MNWMLASIAASLVAASGPVLMVESTAAVRSVRGLTTRRRRLWVATLLSSVAILSWLYVDRSAVAAGERSLAVTCVAAGTFFVLFLGIGYPILRLAPRTAPGVARPRLFHAALDVPVLLVALAIAPAFVLSSNDVGYRLKGAGIVAGGVVLYFMGQPRAPRTFVLFAVSGAITLFAQWSSPWQRSVGAIGQLTVGIIGFVWCARLLTASDSRVA